MDNITLTEWLKKNLTFKTDLKLDTCYGDILEVSYIINNEVIGKNSIQLDQ